MPWKNTSVYAGSGGCDFIIRTCFIYNFRLELYSCTDSTSGTTIKVSLALFYAALPVSGLIMIYYTFVQLLENICYGEAKKIPLPGDEE